MIDIIHFISQWCILNQWFFSNCNPLILLTVCLPNLLSSLFLNWKKSILLIQNSIDEFMPWCIRLHVGLKEPYSTSSNVWNGFRRIVPHNLHHRHASFWWAVFKQMVELHWCNLAGKRKSYHCWNELVLWTQQHWHLLHSNTCHCLDYSPISSNVLSCPI